MPRRTYLRIAFPGFLVRRLVISAPASAAHMAYAGAGGGGPIHAGRDPWSPARSFSASAIAPARAYLRPGFVVTSTCLRFKKSKPLTSAGLLPLARPRQDARVW